MHLAFGSSQQAIEVANIFSALRARHANSPAMRRALQP
jgi:hypothetical protein